MRTTIRLIVAGIVAGGIAAQPAMAASTDIANVPTAVTFMAKSNVMFVLDNSSGMNVETLMPTLNSMYFEPNVVVDLSVHGFFYFQPNPDGVRQGLMTMGFTGNPDGNAWKARYYGYNPQYYNPNATYKPWTGVDLLNAAYTDANPAAAFLDPYTKGAPAWGGMPATINLQQWQSLTAGTFLSTAAGSSASIPNFAPPPSPPATTIQYCDTAAHTSTLSDGTISGTVAYNFTACAGTTSWHPYTSYMWPASFYMWNDLNGDGTMNAGEAKLYMVNCNVSTNQGAPYPNHPPISNAAYGSTVSTANFSWTDPVTGVVTSRTCAQELQNFANWFQYYRTVMLSLKGAMGRAITVMGPTKAGMTDLMHDAPVKPALDMSVAANQTNLQKAAYATVSRDPNGGNNNWRQPMHERVYNIWNYLNGGYSAPAASPIVYACEQNFAIMMTPGYLNDSDPGDCCGPAGWTNPITGVTPPAITTANCDGATCQTQPASTPYQDAYSNTLADWAMYYYWKPIRIPPFAANGLPSPPSYGPDTNTSLHLDTYVIAPGALPAVSLPLATSPYANAQTSCMWNTALSTYNTCPSWPQPTFVAETTVDDLWHAAINGRGIFINSTNIETGLTTVVGDILTRSTGASAAAVSNPMVAPGDNFSYMSSYKPGEWTGDFQAYPIDLSTGAVNFTSPVWTTSAQAQLDARLPATRWIATYNPGYDLVSPAGIGFNWASLSTTMRSLLNSPVIPPGPVDGSTVLDFLRGDRSLESSKYRIRTHVLGDIINAEAVIVLPPHMNYVDSGYQTFVSANAGRTRMAYQGADDGMLHAFVAATGAEQWAYVPGLLFEMPLASYPTKSSLVNLSFLTGFQHLYYLDGTPIVADVDSAGWKTLLVGGLRKGGRGYYALDVTNPSAGSDADVAGKVLWEFPNLNTLAATRANVGYSFGAPIITKTAKHGWVVLVTSGYNNGNDTGGDGCGHLFALAPSTGAVLEDVATGACDPVTPSGLAQISAYASNPNVDNTARYVYGGDLQGNLWRFDVTGMGAWPVAKLATLKDSGGNPQPITTVPQVDLVNNRYHMVLVGTGELLGLTDVPGNTPTNVHATQTQTMYGLMDDLTASPTLIARANLVQQTLTVSATTATISSNPVDYLTKKGWFVDLPTGGERVNVDPALALGNLVFNTNIPSSDPCNPGGSSWEYILNDSTGGAVLTFAGVSFGNTLASRPVLIMLPNGSLVAETRTPNALSGAALAGGGTRGSVSTSGGISPPSGPFVRRVYWREVLTQ
jgi:type IV pilus assembly protein PilY1